MRRLLFLPHARTTGEPKKVAALMYTYVDDMLDKRGPFRLGHLDLLKNMSEEGDCLLGGLSASSSCFCGQNRACRQ